MKMSWRLLAGICAVALALAWCWESRSVGHVRAFAATPTATLEVTPAMTQGQQLVGRAISVAELTRLLDAPRPDPIDRCARTSRVRCPALAQCRVCTPGYAVRRTGKVSARPNCCGILCGWCSEPGSCAGVGSTGIGECSLPGRWACSLAKRRPNGGSLISGLVIVRIWPTVKPSRQSRQQCRGITSLVRCPRIGRHVPHRWCSVIFRAPR